MWNSLRPKRKERPPRARHFDQRSQTERNKQRPFQSYEPELRVWQQVDTPDFQTRSRVECRKLAADRRALEINKDPVQVRIVNFS